MITTIPTTDPPAEASRPAWHPPAARPTSDDVRAVPAVLASEWIKLSSVRATKVLLGLTLLVGGITSWAVATFVTDEVLTVSEVFIYSTVLTGVFAAVAGVLLFTSEAQHGTLALAFTAQPARWVIVVSKTIAAAAVGLVLGAAGMATGVGGAALGGLEVGDTSAMAVTTLWALLFTSLSAVFGLGVGMIVRHGTAAISGFLAWWFVVENLLWLVLPAEVGRFLPFFAGGALLGIESDMATAESIAVSLTRPQNALVFGAYAAVALVAGAVLVARRDGE